MVSFSLRSKLNFWRGTEKANVEFRKRLLGECVCWLVRRSAFVRPCELIRESPVVTTERAITSGPAFSLYFCFVTNDISVCSLSCLETSTTEDTTESSTGRTDAVQRLTETLLLHLLVPFKRSRLLSNLPILPPNLSLQFIYLRTFLLHSHYVTISFPHIVQL